MISNSNSNPNCARTFASLRLYGDQLVPEEVSRRLSLEPTDAAPKGLSSKAPSGQVRTAPTGRWIFSSDGQLDSTNLEQHLVWLLERLEPAGAIPAEMPGVERADVLCYWQSATGHGGPEFSPDVLKRLAALRLPLGLDNYFLADAPSPAREEGLGLLQPRY